MSAFFGKVLSNTNPDFQPFGFAGGLYVSKTGLVRFGARDYDVNIGRWTDKDPLGFNAEENFYRYCGNDPVNYVDVSGLLDLFVFTDIDIVPIFGEEFGVQVTLDVDNPCESGVSGIIGGGVGFNVGAGIGAGFAIRDAEGVSNNFDINLGAVSVTLGWDDKGFNSGALSVGPGFGASGSQTNTSTFSFQNLLFWK